jgi:hypothetical protein
VEKGEEKDVQRVTWRGRATQQTVGLAQDLWCEQEGNSRSSIIGDKTKGEYEEVEKVRRREQESHSKRRVRQG